MTPIKPPQECPLEPDVKAFVDGELPENQRLRIESHLAECAGCAALNRDLRQLTLEVQAMSEQVSCPESVSERVLQALPERGPNRLRFMEFSLVRLLAGAGMAGVLAAIIFPIFATSREAARRSNTTFAQRSEPVSPIPSAPYNDAAAKASGGVPASPSSSANEVELNEAPGRSDGPPASAPMGGAAAQAPTMDGEASTRDFRTQGYGEIKAETRAKAFGMASDDVETYTRGKAIDEVLRKVVKSAQLSVEVNERLETLQDRISKKVTTDEGYVESMDLSSPPAGKRTTRMALRVPVSKFESTIEYLSKLGEVSAKSLGGKDITGTWLDQRKHVRDLRGKEERYAAAYRNARTRAERERARRHLLNLRPILQSSEEQFAATAKLAALAKIDLTLVEAPQAKVRGDLGRDLQNTTKEAGAAFLMALRVPATLLIWLTIFTPLWLPCLLLYRWATRMARCQQTAAADNV